MRATFGKIVFFILFLSFKTFGGELPVLSGAWKGEWSYSEGDVKDPSSFAGTISIFNCKSNECEIELSSGNQFGQCGIPDGKLLIKSHEAAEFNSESCQLNISKKSERLSVTANTCHGFCGPQAEGQWGENYKKYSDVKFYTTSFDCKYAKTKIEVKLCSLQTLAELDKELALNFSILKDKIKSNPKMISKTIKQVQDEQKSWIGQRNEKCETATNLEMCLTELYSKRSEELKKMGASSKGQ